MKGVSSWLNQEGWDLEGDESLRRSKSCVRSSRVKRYEHALEGKIDECS